MSESMAEKIRRLQSELDKSRRVTNAFIAKDLDSSSVARARIKKLTAENEKLRKLILNQAGDNLHA